MATVSVKGTVSSNSGSSSGSSCEVKDGLDVSLFSCNLRMFLPDPGVDSFRHVTDEKSMDGQSDVPSEGCGGIVWLRIMTMMMG